MAQLRICGLLLASVINSSAIAGTLLWEETQSFGGTYSGISANLKSDVVGMQFYFGYEFHPFSAIVDPSDPFGRLVNVVDREALTRNIGGNLILGDMETGTFDFDASNSPAFDQVVRKLRLIGHSGLTLGGMAFNEDDWVRADGSATGPGSARDLPEALRGKSVQFIRLLVEEANHGSVNLDDSLTIGGRATWQIFTTPVPTPAAGLLLVSALGVLGWKNLRLS
ncbi:MAG: hypothetical protein RLW61_03260 [Gammaproteobacteria bacterium]